MKTIDVRRTLTTGLAPDFANVRTLMIDDAPLGEGGFGVVYKVRLINGRYSLPQVVKILLDNGHGVAQRGYATIQELQRRLHAKHLDYVKSGSTLVDRQPGLLGVPQLSFEGQLDGRTVIGYCASDLVAEGMTEFAAILDDETKTREFQALPQAQKTRMASQLVTAFQFLSSHIRYVHADLKCEALFLDVKRGRCAVIDYDSGALARDASDRPTTFGTKQDWLAPEIVRQLDAPGNAGRLIKVDLLSDIWSVNIAIHYLLFGFHPLFFLTEISARSISAYLRQFRWPDVSSSFKYFRRDYDKIYYRYATFLRRAIPAEIVKRLAFTINEGFRTPSARTTYGQWTAVFGGLNRPSIKSFSADRTAVDDRRPVRLTWEVVGAAKLELSGVGDVTHLSWMDVNVRRDSSFTLTLTSDQGGLVTTSLAVTVSKAPPTIHYFRTARALLTDAKPARLEWRVSGAERIDIDGGVGDVSGLTHIDVRPRKGTTYTLTATTLFGVQIKAAVRVDVSSVAPRIDIFQADRPILTDTDVVELSWAVSDDAHDIQIGGIGPVPKAGSRKIRQTRDTTYTLRAASYFGVSTEAHVVVRVSNAPPRIDRLEAHPVVVRECGQAELSWSVRGAVKVRVDPYLGLVASEGRAVIRVEKSGEVILSATTLFGVSAFQRLTLKILRHTELNQAHSTMLPVRPIPLASERATLAVTTPLGSKPRAI